MAQEILNEVANVPGGTIGYLVGAAVVAYQFISKWNNTRTGENAQLKAITEDNARLENRLRDADKRAEEAIDDRDAMAQERNGLIREFSEIKAQYAAVNERLEWLTKQNDQVMHQNTELLKQNTELSNQVRTLLQQRA